jgi:hypothetical protein
MSYVAYAVVLTCLSINGVLAYGCVEATLHQHDVPEEGVEKVLVAIQVLTAAGLIAATLLATR